MVDDFVRPPKHPAAAPTDGQNQNETFKTPEQTAAADLRVVSEPAGKEQPMELKSASKWHVPTFIRPPYSKKEKIVASVLAVVMVFGIGAGITYVQHHRPVKALTPAKHAVKTVPKPVVIYSSLSGLPVPNASVNQRPVTGVMVENSTDARPQSGLNQAGVVYEAIAEGGITRFLTLYQDNQPDYLGPVRSARPYYLQWCMGFDCSLAHVGGSPEALQDIKAWGVKDLDQFYNAGAYQRIASRYAPHNVYTSTAQLNQLEVNKGYGASVYTGFVRKADSPSKTPNAASIDFAISYGDYNVHYDYDATTDSYKRSEGGAPHMAVNKDGSQVQLQPKVVVAMVMQYGLEADDHHSQYNVVGSGQAYVFQDGTVTPATWNKADSKSQVTFTDSAGKPIAFNRGQTWLTALSAAGQATYR